MKITLELPDSTKCAFVDYVYYERGGIVMRSQGLDTGDLVDGAEIKIAEDEDGKTD